MEKIPGVGEPCRRALVEAGYNELVDLNGADITELLALHGVGATGLKRIDAKLQEQGMSLSGQWPKAKKPSTKKAEVKTQPTSQDPAEFIASLDVPRRVEHGTKLLEIFGRATGVKPVMWGKDQVGYGTYTYEYASGRTGDWYKVGFSPRKAKLSLYGISGNRELLDKLGKHTTGVGCLYVNKLEDIDIAVLEEMIAEAFAGPDQGSSC